MIFGIICRFRAVFGLATHKVVLSRNVSCSNCILQWRYRTGRNILSKIPQFSTSTLLLTWYSKCCDSNSGGGGELMAFMINHPLIGWLRVSATYPPPTNLGSEHFDFTPGSHSMSDCTFMISPLKSLPGAT